MNSNDTDKANYQKQILRQFKCNLGDILTTTHTDNVLLKFLRARNFNLKKAEENFRMVDATRKLQGIENVTETFVMKEVYELYRGDTFLGFAKDGSAIRYITAKLDYNGFLHSCSAYELCQYFTYYIESDLKRLKEENLKTGRNVDEITYIGDLEGYSLQELTYKSVIEVGLNSVTMFQDFYPEVWRHILFVNVPVIFNTLFQIFKPILKDTFIQKIQVATKDSSRELLRNYIDDDVLPAFLGGKKTDSKGDAYCKEFMRFGGKIPERYYLRNHVHLIDETDPGVNVVMIGARSSFNVPSIVREPGTRIRVEMRTEYGSIAYVTLYRDFGTDHENPDLPSSDEYLDPGDKRCNVAIAGCMVKVQSHLAPYDGTCLLTRPGIYFYQFDNTSSWFGSRKLYYRITRLPRE